MDLIYISTKTFMNEATMARHGLILSQDEATAYTDLLETFLAYSPYISQNLLKTQTFRKK